MDEQEEQSPALLFAHCVALVRNPPPSLRHVKLAEDQKLRLYGLYKQATEGENATPSPGLLDFVGRAKWNAWKACAGMSMAEAQVEYTANVQAWYGNDCLIQQQQQKASSSSSTTTSTTATNSSASSDGLHLGGAGEIHAVGAIGAAGLLPNSGNDNNGQQEDDEPQDIFYFAKRGRVADVAARLADNTADINAQDEEGRSLLHWAVDGNHGELVDFLLARNADTTLQDHEGETCLDYAVLCEHEGLVELLTKRQQAAGGSGEEDAGK